MTPSAFTAAVAMSLAASLAIVPADSASVLDGWRDTRRPLLLFAASDKDTNLRTELDRLEEAGNALRERDVVVAVCAGDYPALRQRLNVPAGRFTAVLVGKDGGEKWRTEHPFAAAEVMSLIDAMPMGKREAEERSKRH